MTTPGLIPLGAGDAEDVPNLASGFGSLFFTQDGTAFKKFGSNAAEPLVKESDSFESIAKNLNGYPVELEYSDGVLTSATYTLEDGEIVKTLNYSGDLLTSIVLSGDTPDGIALTKTLTYTNGTLTGVSYS